MTTSWSISDGAGSRRSPPKNQCSRSMQCLHSGPTGLPRRAGVATHLDAALRPIEAQYLMPEQLRECPPWGCSPHPTHWSANGTTVADISADLHDGDAAMLRLTMPQDACVTVAAGVDPFVRTKVLAAGTARGTAAEVCELGPGEDIRFNGKREVLTLQVNAQFLAGRRTSLPGQPARPSSGAWHSQNSRGSESGAIHYGTASKVHSESTIN